METISQKVKNLYYHQISVGVHQKKKKILKKEKKKKNSLKKI